MSKKKGDQKVKLAVAGVVLMLGVGWTVKSVVGLGRPAAPSVPASADPPPADGPVDPMAGSQGPQDPAATGPRDLLEAIGSYQPGAAVTHSFRKPEATPVGSAPGGETRPTPTGPVTLWEGQDPPELTIGMVLRGGAVQRAVIDGVVVGIGDAVGGGELALVGNDGVRLVVAGRTLSYPLGKGYPLEFAPELARRQAAAQAAQQQQQQDGGAGGGAAAAGGEATTGEAGADATAGPAPCPPGSTAGQAATGTAAPPSASQTQIPNQERK